MACQRSFLMRRTMRAGMFHLRDRRPDVYGPLTDTDAMREAKWRELAHA